MATCDIITAVSTTKRRLAAGILLSFALWSAGPVLLACGDKFLVVSRGTRFERPAMRHAARILVYANPISGFAKSLATAPMERTLRKAGYDPMMVISADQLDKALTGGEWDLVLADLADASDIQRRLRAGTSPRLLPVVSGGTGATVKDAKKQYGRVLKSTAKGQSLLDAVDEILSAR